MKIIGLDAGHGLKTAGKQTPTGIKEWALNDDVCDKITEILSNYDCKIIRTDHNEGNIDESLAARVKEYINAGADVLISIHHDAYTGMWNNATGFTIYTDRTPTSADNKLAEILQNNMCHYMTMRNRGIKRANWQIINQDRIPAVLLEGGFMDGVEDYKIITSEQGKYNYALSVALSLIEFLKLKKKSETEKINIFYQSHIFKDNWTLYVSANKISGTIGKSIDAVRIKTTRGNFYYAVHVISGNRWLPTVRNDDDYAGNLNQKIDAIMIKTDTGEKLNYAVHEKVTNRWLPPVTGYNKNDSKNGYAGNFGKEIDAIKIWFE